MDERFISSKPTVKNKPDDSGPAYDKGQITLFSTQGQISPVEASEGLVEQEPSTIELPAKVAGAAMRPSISLTPVVEISQPQPPQMRA